MGDEEQLELLLKQDCFVTAVSSSGQDLHKFKQSMHTNCQVNTGTRDRSLEKEERYLEK